ncbi:MAG TPA: hypothetical protein VFZ61_16720, partial [Polyangiales bacterium]
MLAIGGPLAACESQGPESEQGTEIGESQEALKSAEGVAPGLQVRPSASKPSTAERIGPHSRRDEIILKLVEGSRVRLSGGRLSYDAARVRPEHEARLNRSGLTKAGVGGEAAALHELLSKRSVKIKRLFERGEEELDREQQQLETSSGEELADLNLYYSLAVREADAESLITQLNASPLVEVAYAAPIPVLAAMDVAPVTPSFVREQSYLDAPPLGIDARFAWTRPGGDGFGKRVIDVEAGWN